MKKEFAIGRFLGVLCLLLVFLASSSATTLLIEKQTVKKETVTHKKSETQPETVIKKADEAVVPIFSVKLLQQAFVTFERTFYILSDEKPRHPDSYPVYRQAFFANIFSKAIAINAP